MMDVEMYNGNEGYLELYWDDLTQEAQDKIIEIFGDNCNYDAIPIVSLRFSNLESEEE